MRRLQILVVALLSLVYVAIAQSRDDSFFFIQLADPQFGFFSDDKDFNQETENFSRAIAAANRLEPAFVVVCGDLVNRMGDSAQIGEYRRIAAQLKPTIPLYNVPGNHDVGNRPTPETLALYREWFGPDYYMFSSDNAVGIVLNSSLIKDPEGAPKEATAQESWLRSILEQVISERPRSIMVFQHHPWFLKDSDEPEGYFNIHAERRKEYLELFLKSGVRFIFAGHYHRNAIGQFNEIEMVTTGPVGRPLGADPSGLRIVVVRGTHVDHTYYGLDRVPEHVTLD